MNYLETFTSMSPAEVHQVFSIPEKTRDEKIEDLKKLIK